MQPEIHHRTPSCRSARIIFNPFGERHAFATSAASDAVAEPVSRHFGTIERFAAVLKLQETAALPRVVAICSATPLGGFQITVATVADLHPFKYVFISQRDRPVNAWPRATSRPLFPPKSADAFHATDVSPLLCVFIELQFGLASGPPFREFAQFFV